ncbi:hypothetical protein LR004_03175 [Candidatus Gracilibacteria bacterium]|nr:hypothetical protein [Candidatus Gracilibacteria bacterium]
MDGEEEFNVEVGRHYFGEVDIVWKGKDMKEGWNEITGNNELLAIKFEGENTGKKETFLGFYGTKLITKDDFEYGYKDSMQVAEPQEGLSGCIECSMNPGDKAEQYLIFDIKKIDLAGAKIRLDDQLIEFEL